MNRQYIGFEKGNHITDILLERMNLVVNGEKGGISQVINWIVDCNFIKKNTRVN